MKYYEFSKIALTAFIHKGTGLEVSLATTYKIGYHIEASGEPFIEAVHINGVHFIPELQSQKLDLVGDWVYEDMENRQKAVVKQAFETFKQTA